MLGDQTENQAENMTQKYRMQRGQFDKITIKNTGQKCETWVSKTMIDTGAKGLAKSRQVEEQELDSAGL